MTCSCIVYKSPHTIFMKPNIEINFKFNRMSQCFKNKKLEEWSKDDAKEWLKFCLTEYNLDDPRIAENFNLNGKTIKIFHNFREFNKFYSQGNAEKLHRDLDMRQRTNVEGLPSTNTMTPIKFESNQMEHNLFDPFLPHLEKIDSAFAAIIKKDKNQMTRYSMEVIIEALFALNGDKEKVPEVCLMNRLTTPLFEPKQINTTQMIDSPLNKLERGCLNLRIPIDTVLGSLVKNFYLQKYPIIAESTIEHMLYLGQQNAIPTNFKASLLPPVLFYSTTHPKNSSPSIYANDVFILDIPEATNKNESKISTNSVDSGLTVSPKSSKKVSNISAQSVDSGLTASPKQSNEFEENKNNLEDDDNYEYEYNNAMEKIDLNLSAKGKHIIADYSANGETGLTFDYNENLALRFKVESFEDNPKVVTTSCRVQIEINNTTGSHIGFSLSTYNLSKPGSHKIVYPIVKGLKILAPNENWTAPFELQHKELNTNRDYIIFELLVCELNETNPKWNLQRAYILICKEDPTNIESSKDSNFISNPQFLINKQAGNEKRKHCILILLESLYYLIKTDQGKGYWLTTQLLLIPEFQRPHFLILCWLVIGTYVYQGEFEDFDKKRQFVTLMNAKNDIKKRISNLENKVNKNAKYTNAKTISDFQEKRTLKSVLDCTKQSETILENYLEKNASKMQRANVTLTPPPPHVTPNVDNIFPIIEVPETPLNTENENVVFRMPYSKSESAIAKILQSETSHLKIQPREELLTPLSRDISCSGCEIIQDEFIIKCLPFKYPTKLDFSYKINKTEKFQSTCIPNVKHLSTFEIDNHVEEVHPNATYEITLNLKTKFLENSNDLFKFILETEDTVTDVTEVTFFKVNCENEVCTATIDTMGAYHVMQIKNDPSILAIKAVKEASLIRPLYFQLYANKLEESQGLAELTCSVTSSCIDSIHSAYSHVIPLVREELSAKFNDEICIQIKAQHSKESDRLFSDFTHKFLFNNYPREFSRVMDKNKIKDAKFTAKLLVNNKLCLSRNFIFEKTN